MREYDFFPLSNFQLNALNALVLYLLSPSIRMDILHMLVDKTNDNRHREAYSSLCMNSILCVLLLIGTQVGASSHNNELLLQFPLDPTLSWKPQIICHEHTASSIFINAYKWCPRIFNVGFL